MRNEPESALQAQIANALLKANHMLGYDNQLRPDDPLISFVALNETLYKAYLDALNQAVTDAQARFSTALEQELAQAKSATTEMIEQTGVHLQDQLEQVGVAWEAQFQNRVAQSIAQIQDITQLNFLGALCWFGSGAIMMGISLLKILKIL